MKSTQCTARPRDGHQPELFQMPFADRVQNLVLKSHIMSADEAATLIPAGAQVGISGFTGAGYPKAVPQALALRIESLHPAG